MSSAAQRQAAVGKLYSEISSSSSSSSLPPLQLCYFSSLTDDHDEGNGNDDDLGIATGVSLPPLSVDLTQLLPMMFISRDDIQSKESTATCTSSQSNLLASSSSSSSSSSLLPSSLSWPSTSAAEFRSSLLTMSFSPALIERIEQFNGGQLITFFNWDRFGEDQRNDNDEERSQWTLKQIVSLLQQCKSSSLGDCVLIHGVGRYLVKETDKTALNPLLSIVIRLALSMGTIKDLKKPEFLLVVEELGWQLIGENGKQAQVEAILWYFMEKEKGDVEEE